MTTQPSKFILEEKELNDLERNASVADAIREFMSLLTNRSQDLPHRFKCPKAFAEYMADWGTNSSYYQQIQIPSSSSANYMSLQMTTRPTQRILELCFIGADGTRLFTLELEY